MTHSLIITAHPSSKGFTHEIATTYLKALKEAGKTGEIMNLYTPEWKQDYLEYEDMKAIAKDEKVLAIQEKIRNADELVLVFPVWWGDAPAILKNFMDTNFSAGFAFRFLENGKSEGLLKRRTAKIFTTCDGPGFVFKTFPGLTRFGWGSFRLGFCGIKTTSFDILGEKNKKSRAELDEFLTLVTQRAGE
ncbi:MAG: NAD(P)H-dependent oxidoreductase [Candidatus Peregrinibacteria bacterium]